MTLLPSEEADLMEIAAGDCAPTRPAALLARIASAERADRLIVEAICQMNRRIDSLYQRLAIAEPAAMSQPSVPGNRGRAAAAAPLRKGRRGDR